MDYALYYFSGTGNTKLISTEIMKVIEVKRKQEMKVSNLELISIENLEECSIRNLKSTVVGIGFPVHKFTFPRNFQVLFRYLKKLRNSQLSSSNKRIPAFIFCTYTRFPANSLENMNKELKKIGFDPIFSQAFKCPSNGIASMKDPSSYEYQSVMYFEHHIDKKISNFVQELEEKIQEYKISPFSIKNSRNPIESLKLTIVESIEHTKYPFLQIDDSCVLCGACVKACPEHNLVKEEKEIRIIDPVDCLHCLRCMHHCPQKSISFGELTTGSKRYTPNVIRKLYKDSVNGIGSAYEKDFQSIVKQWRKDTLAYWKEHREKQWWKNTRKRMKSRNFK